MSTRACAILALACGLSACSGDTPAAGLQASAVSSRARGITNPMMGGSRPGAPQVRSVDEYFATLPERFVPDAARGMHVVYQFDLDGQVWQVAVDDGKIQVYRGARRRADTVLTMAGDDYVRMANGQLDGMRAYLGGRLKIAGSLRMARRMRALFPPSRPVTVSR